MTRERSKTALEVARKIPDGGVLERAPARKLTVP
jgi:hypothetical protein